MPLELKRGATREETRILDRKFLRVLAGNARQKAAHEFGTASLLDADEVRALSATIVTGGGAVVAEGFSDRLEAALVWASPMRMHAEVFRTETGSDVPWPLTDDTGEEGVILQENVIETESDMSFQQTTLRTFKFSSKRVLVPVELVEDSPLLAGQLGKLLGLRIGRLQNRVFTVGTGAAQPQGVVNAAKVGATSLNSSAIVSDDVNALIESVDPSYQINGRFMCHQSVWQAISNLRDGAGRPIYPQHVPGQRTLQGFPVELNRDMASTVTSGAICLLFGDFSSFKIRDCRELRVRSYSEALNVAELGLTAFSALLRSDGALLDAGTGSVKSLQQHS